ncbi:hypothetical protein A8C32_16650 [Flavivirga aquatica]|uniref:Lipocalin-like domain-containing protein n=1 Tax=Flavivirga aquatica TaxID=1849968 RepID=A0A1E5T8N6_9FLAO|nr:hypothetical protein [Flavivirga aquatica]OEK07734.1 hypothetical protein A8C32_16650 [Flavivirga aquatica]
MKKLNLLFILTVFTTLTFTSCSSNDDSNSGSKEEETGTVKIPLTTIEQGVSIEGAVKNQGTPPAPNSNLDFQISTTNQDAFLNSGFNIQFASNDNIAGAYIVLKDTDGNNASDYLDVPASAFNNEGGSKSGKSSAKSKKVDRSTTNKAKEDEENDTIKVSFDTHVPVGNFCYDICLYDASNNISQIQTICVTINSWGGNTSIVGEWVFDREDDNNNNSTTITCDNEDTIEANYDKIIKEEWTFVLNEDGTYYEIYNDEFQSLNYSESEASCTVTYDTEIKKENEKFSGNWTYNEDDKTLTVIDFKREDFIDSSKNEEFENGEVYFAKVIVEVISGQLVITETDGDDIIKIYFNKK